MSGASISDGEMMYVYAIGIGSNRPMRQLGPRDIVRAAFAALAQPPLRLIAQSPIVASRPLGPSDRTYSNAAALIETALSPLDLLDHLQAIERSFGRKRYRRWGSRTLDLDILLWSGGKVRNKRLTVPHASLRERAFALTPLAAIAPHWRDPVTGLTIAHITARLLRAHPSTKAVDPNRSPL